jgi:putative heme iron utilization protein
MEIKDLVDILRELSKNYEDIDMYLPKEMVNIINGKRQEEAWEKISIGKVMRYMSDIIER